MRIAVVGIGGVGGYFGGKLARAYATSGKHEVIFIARGEHLKAIQEKGLQVFTKEGDFIAWPSIATDNPEIAGPVDLVLFCVKSYSLDLSAHLLKNCIKKDTIVIPLLNGVESADRLRSILPHADIVSGSVYIISHIEKPGIIRQEGGACRLTFGTDDELSARKYDDILELFILAQIKAILTDRISEVLWTKFLLMCPLASLTSYTGKTYGAIAEDPALMKKAKGLMEEVVAVAKTRSIYLSSELVDKTLEMIAGFGYRSKTSMQMDFEKGNQTEVDILTAYLCQAGRKAGIPTPLHDEIYERISRQK